MRAIARRLNRSPGTISKELCRNQDDFGLYVPTHAHRKSVLRRFRPKKRKIDSVPDLWPTVMDMLREKFSPEQIAGRLRNDHPGDDTMHMFTATIYITSKDR